LVSQLEAWISSWVIAAECFMGDYLSVVIPKHPSPGASVMLSVLLPLEERGTLLAGSFTRFWRFTIEQPSRLFLSLAGFRACLLAGRR
jgi:hypothetical protein